MINNSEFLVGKVPDFHPIAERYEMREWWKEQKRRCIEGFWVGGKWMPPELYYYVNFHNIKYETDEGVSTAIGLPWLRDIEWEKAYLYTEACGFSGFEKDTKFTCDRRYGPEKDLHLRLGWITQEELNQKTYIDVREYLHRPYTSNMGKPIYRNSAKNVIDLEGRGGGKDLEANTLIYTENGPIPIKDVNVGDSIFGADGKLTKVIERRDFKDQLQYEVEFVDGRKIECGGGHLWNIYKYKGSHKNGTKRKELVTVELNDIKDNYLSNPRKNGLRDKKYSIPLCKPLEYKEKNLPINPYFIGLWLGDGNTHNPGITTADSEIVEFVHETAKEWGLHVKKTNYTDTKRCPTYHINCAVQEINHRGNPLKQELRNLNLLGNKHVPEIYKRGSVEQRLELVKGYLDADGYCGKNGDNGHIEFVSKIETLADDIIEVLQSLGCKTRKVVKHVNNVPYYRVYVTSLVPIFKLERKRGYWSNDGSDYAKLYRNVKRTELKIAKITPTSIKHSVCIAVDNKDKLFVAGDHIVTHNSYWASGCIAHNFLFDGARDYDYYLQRKRDKEPFVSDTVVGAIDAKFSGDLLDKVKVGVENLPGKTSIATIDGDIEEYNSPLYTKYSGSLAPGKKWINRSGSVLNHRTFADNPLAANGTRPNRVFLEEVGFMNNIIEAWGAIEATQAAAEGKRLVIYGLGTGGLTTAGAALYTQEIFYHPENYNCVSFPNEWEEGKHNQKIGYFVPAQKTRNKFKEGPNKITNFAKATEIIKQEIEDAKNSGSRVTYLAKVINNPQVPADIFLRAEGVFFPIHELKNTLADLERNTLLLEASYKVDLRLEQGKVIMYPSDLQPIREYPLTKSSIMDACVEIFEKPKEDMEGIVHPERYILSVDPVDDDGNDDTGKSLQSTFVLDTFTNRIVAEYTARTYLAETYYENVRKLCMLYNGKILYENNKKGLYGHFKNKNSLWMLVETPQILKDQEIVKSTGIGNRALGVNVTDRVKLFGIQLILKWLEGESYTNPEKKNLTTIRSVALLKELIAYSLDVNADRVSSLIVLMIFLADLGERTTEKVNRSRKTLANDSFWGRAYKNFNNTKVYNQNRNSSYERRVL